MGVDARGPTLGRVIHLIDRRAFIGGLALGRLAGPHIAWARTPRKIARIGIIGLGATSQLAGARPLSPSTRALLQGLDELGYVYGRDFVTEARGVEGKPEHFPGVATALVGLRVDVIVAAGPALPALRAATSTIPIVMAASSDPVGLGYVQSLSHPGGNITGLSLQSIDTTGKRLELLKELVPSAVPVAVVWDPGSLLYWQAAEAAARERGWKLLSVPIRDAAEIGGVFKAATDARAGAMLVSASALLFPQAKRIAELAARSRLPVMYELRPYVEAGGLISYGADINHIWRRAAGFVDKILRGADPGNLPVEQPSKFELVINLGAAKSIGLAIPPSLQLRTDDVIR